MLRYSFLKLSSNIVVEIELEETAFTLCENADILTILVCVDLMGSDLGATVTTRLRTLDGSAEGCNVFLKLNPAVYGF